MSISSTGGEVTDALNGKLTFEQSKNRIVGRDENNVARLLILADNNDFSMKVSKDNTSVIGAADSGLVFNSNNNLFKIVSSGTVTLNRGAGVATVSVNVATPVGASAFLAWGTLTNVSPQLTYQLTYYAPNGTGGILWGVRAYYDATLGQVRFFHESYNATVTASAYDLSIKYYLLQETLT